MGKMCKKGVKVNINTIKPLKKYNILIGRLERNFSQTLKIDVRINVREDVQKYKRR